MFPFLPVAILPIASDHIKAQKHYHNLTNDFRGLSKAENLLNTKAAIFGNGGFYAGPRTQVEMLLITPRSPQGDIVQVDHACLSGPIDLKHKDQFFHVCEGRQ
jgi:hypothetical protein